MLVDSWSTDFAASGRARPQAGRTAASQSQVVFGNVTGQRGPSMTWGQQGLATMRHAPGHLPCCRGQHPAHIDDFAFAVGESPPEWTNDMGVGGSNNSKHIL